MNDTKSAAERLRDRDKQYHVHAGPTGWADANPGYVGSDQEDENIRLVAAACLAETDPTRQRAIFDAGFMAAVAYGDNHFHYHGKQADAVFAKAMARLTKEAT